MADLSKPIGVLFVHGIGAEKQGETLLSYSEPVFNWIARWLRASDGTAAPGDPPAQSIEVINTELFPKNGAPAHSHWVMHLRDGENNIQDTHWIAAESWWAETIVASNWRHTIKWAREIVPSIVFFQLSNFVHREIHREESEFLDRTLAWLFTIPYAAFGFLVLFLLNILALLLGILALVQALLPIGLLRSVTQSIQVIISQWAGDLFLVINSPVQRSAMVSQVQKDLEWMKKRCSQIVIVAHSQGAAITYQVLQEDRSPKIKGFVTLGSAIKLLKKVESVQKSGLQKNFGLWFFVFVPLYLISLAIFLKSLRPFFSIADAAAASASAAGFDWWNVLISSIPFVFVIMLLIVLVHWLDRDRTWDPLKGERSLKRNGFRWCDLYASNDPAPDGRLSRNLPDFVESSQVYNRANLLLDHTTYWENIDEFVSAVVVFLSEVTNTRFVDSRDASCIQAAKARRRYRFGWLLRSRTASLASALVLLAFLRNELPSYGVSTLEAVNWILGFVSRKLSIPLHPSVAINILGGIVLVAIPIFWYAFTLRFWGWWQDTDLQKLFRREEGKSDLWPFRSVAALMGILLLGTAGSIVVVRGNVLTTLGLETAHPLVNGLIFAAAVLLVSIGLARLLPTYIPSRGETKKWFPPTLATGSLTRDLGRPSAGVVLAWAPVVLSALPILLFWVYHPMQELLSLVFTLAVTVLAWWNTLGFIRAPDPSLMRRVYLLAIGLNTLVYVIWMLTWLSR